MGNIEKMLFDGEVKKESDVYADMHTIERCEDFHLHWRNLRLIFDRREFEVFCQAIGAAYEKWIGLGYPNPVPGKDLPEYLYSSSIRADHGRRSSDLKIEAQGDLPHMPKDMIHIHHKSIRLDVSHREFVELAEAFASALKEFKKWKGVPK